MYKRQTLSSAIASNLALGKDLEEAVRRAKKYLTGALAAGLDLGAGSGPLNHMFLLSQNRVAVSYTHLVQIISAVRSPWIRL